LLVVIILVTIFFKGFLDANMQYTNGYFEIVLYWIMVIFVNLQNFSPLIVSCYNFGNDFYKGFLDANMQYTNGYFRFTKDDDLEESQNQKLIGSKLGLKKGMKVLDVGCGWGVLCQFFSKEYDCEVTGVTLSDEQSKLCFVTIKI
jgi:cyclopropane fatty-acyl-phospholipid synthase-like methyltransferase